MVTLANIKEVLCIGGNLLGVLDYATTRYKACFLYSASFTLLGKVKIDTLNRLLERGMIIATEKTQNCIWFKATPALETYTEERKVSTVKGADIYEAVRKHGAKIRYDKSSAKAQLMSADNQIIGTIRSDTYFKMIGKGELVRTSYSFNYETYTLK